jgi:PleD family two-component response regulator
MPPSGRHTTLPLVLIGNAQEWSARSLESVFAVDEYEVHRLDSGRDVIQHARSMSPDLIILDQNLRDLDSTAVCRVLRDDPRIGLGTPIVIVTAATTIDRAKRLLALDAGAWDVLSLPLEGDILLLRLRNFLSAKQESDRIRHGILVDAQTGTYNRRGLEMLGRELGADVGRAGEPMACVALTLDVVGSSARASTAKPVPAQLAEYLADLLKQRGRVSDVVGRLDEDEFALLLPYTGEQGVQRMFLRLQETINGAPPIWVGGDRNVRLCGGYSLAEQSQPRIDVAALLDEAHNALRSSRPQTNDAPLVRYATIPKISS